jgi:hypothetical protein
MMMDEICLRKLTEIRTILENKVSELDLPAVLSISFEKEIEISESIINRCKDNKLLAIRQKIEKLIPDSDEILSSINEIIDDINVVIASEQ